jgi:hypothetical protein
VSRSSGGEVIPLSFWRAALARARSSRRASALYELPDAARVVPTLPVQDLYYLIRELGLADSRELLALASPTQVRGFLDFDVWDRDHLAPRRMAEWIDALCDLGPERLARVLGAVDVELPSLWLAEHARVYDLSLGEAPPEDTSHPLLPTPDGFFLIELHAQGEAARTCERLLDTLYRADRDLARRVVMGARWELPSELEEASYRWRSGRMADLGFVDYYDALEIYRYLDPQSVRIGEGTAQQAADPGLAEASEPAATVPAPYVEPLAEDSFFHRAMASLGEEEVGPLSMQVVALANRVMAAERIDPADLGGVQAGLLRALGHLSMGLEYVARGDAAAGSEALRTVALVRLFRAGVSLTLQLGRLAQTLVRRQRARFDPPWDAFVEALARPVPLLALPGEPAPRAFRAVADIRAAAHLVEQVSWQGTLVLDRLGFTEPSGTFGDLVRTAAANLALGRAFAPTPLAAADLVRLRATLVTSSGQIRPALRQRIDAEITRRAPDAPAFSAPMVDGFLARLADELAPLVESPDPRFVGGLLLTPQA